MMTCDFGMTKAVDWRKERSLCRRPRRLFGFSSLMTTETVRTHLGLLVEELGNQVHVTYGGTQALDVATAFRPDLMLVDLAMPDMDGCASRHALSPDSCLRSNENRGHHRP